MTRQIVTRPSAALLAAALVAGCGPIVDVGDVGEDPEDLRVVADQSKARDMARPRDLAAPRDLAGQPPDDLTALDAVAPVEDLLTDDGAAPDMAAPADGAISADLAQPDLAQPDLAPPADLARPRDLVPGPDLKPPPALRDDAKAAWYWHDQVKALNDTTTLPGAFSAAGYKPPTRPGLSTGTYLIAARVVAGMGQPAFRFYAWGDTGFAYSAGEFWPASTVKLTAAVGALRTLKKYGLTGAATVSFSDSDGSYNGTVRNLYQQAIIPSNNIAYNRLVEIAGFDELNEDYLSPAEGLPWMALQRRYTVGTDLRNSPKISYSEGGKSGSIPARVGVAQYPSCPNRGNCTTLYELMEVARRVTLDTELPSGDRLPLGATDLGNLRSDLKSATPNYFATGAAAALGHSVTTYQKTGEVYDDDRLDAGLIVDNTTGRRFLLAWSMPYNNTSASIANELTRQTIKALDALPDAGAMLQRDAGAKITVQLDDRGAVAGGRAYDTTIDAAGADAIDVFVDGWKLEKFNGPSPYFSLSRTFSKSGDRLMTVHALKGGKLIGYRALTIHIN